MAINVGSRLKRAWNAFTNRDPPGKNYYGGGSSYRKEQSVVGESFGIVLFG